MREHVWHSSFDKLVVGFWRLWQKWQKSARHLLKKRTPTSEKVQHFCRGVCPHSNVHTNLLVHLFSSLFKLMPFFDHVRKCHTWRMKSNSLLKHIAGILADYQKPTPCYNQLPSTENTTFGKERTLFFKITNTQLILHSTFISGTEVIRLDFIPQVHVAIDLF